ncbi:hypothetical protein MalM25_05550 [Planctomycetes bacterium MalM25]|nr:hypothetical protein MalM25_05550 [Planctomycetes bacterium MalM25]
MRSLSLLAAVAAFLCAGVVNAGTVSLIGPGIGEGNGDFNYEGGGTLSGVGTATPGEDIPRDRFFAPSPNIGATVDVDDWTLVRVAYSGGNNAFGLDGHYGFDAASFEPNNTGSGQAFTNGNSNTIVDVIADTISGVAGSAGDVIDLSYLLGSDSNSGTANANATVTLTLDAGLPSEQVSAFALQNRAGFARDGSTLVTEQYISTGAFSTVDLTIQMNPGNGTRSLVDDVRLTADLAIPEPGSVALSMLALAGFGAVSMRRRLG